MVKFRAKVRGVQLCVTVRLSAQEEISDRELRLLTEQPMRGLLRPRLTKHFFWRQLEYTGPAGVSLQHYLQAPRSKYDFFFIMGQVTELIRKLKARDLFLHRIVFDLRQIYINETTKEVQFLYLPLLCSHFLPDVIGFMESVIYAMTPQPGEGEYLSEFNYFLKSLPDFDVDRVDQYIAKTQPTIISRLRQHGVGQSGFMTNKREDYYAHVEAKIRAAMGEESTALLVEDEGTALLQEETALLEEEGTSLLQGAQEASAWLERVSTGERIDLTERVFRLGKERHAVDYVIDNGAVSRNHADIITREDRHYVRDLGSKNQTYVNDEALLPEEERRLYEGDRLLLADEGFVFHRAEAQ